MSNKRRGYKAFKKDFKCLDFQYKENEIFVLEDPELELCENGLHFCKDLNDVFLYYGHRKDLIICEVEALGDILTDGNKSCTNILAVKEKIIDFSDLNTVEKYKDRFNNYAWDRISKYQTLSKDFIEKHADRVNWYFISVYQTLSEDFIERHADKVDWDYISEYQTLSEEFKEKHNLI